MKKSLTDTLTPNDVQRSINNAAATIRNYCDQSITGDKVRRPQTRREMVQIVYDDLKENIVDTGYVDPAYMTQVLIASASLMFSTHHLPRPPKEVEPPPTQEVLI